MPKSKDQKRFDAICRMLNDWKDSYRFMPTNRQWELIHVLYKLPSDMQVKIRSMYPAYFVGKDNN